MMRRNKLHCCSMVVSVQAASPDSSMNIDISTPAQVALLGAVHPGASITTTASEDASLSFHVERRIWLASKGDLCKQAGGECICTCPICLDTVEEAHGSQVAIVTACGHVFHAACARACEQVSIRDRSLWECPSCREIITSVRCVYNNLFINGSPAPEATGSELRELMQHNRPVFDSVMGLLRHFVIGSRPSDPEPCPSHPMLIHPSLELASTESSIVGRRRTVTCHPPQGLKAELVWQQPAAQISAASSRNWTQDQLNRMLPPSLRVQALAGGVQIDSSVQAAGAASGEVEVVGRGAGVDDDGQDHEHDEEEGAGMPSSHASPSSQGDDVEIKGGKVTQNKLPFGWSPGIYGIRVELCMLVEDSTWPSRSTYTSFLRKVPAHAYACAI